jgi:3-oxoacyl-[acyl-carrier-protein] synthase-1
MADAADIVITGAGALCAAGKQPGEIWEAVRSGRSALSPIKQWDSSEWPRRIAGEIADLDPVALLRDRKIQKLIRRSDVFGLYAAEQAIEVSRLTAHRDTLSESAAAEFSDRTGVYVGSGGGSYQSQYDYFPLLTSAAGDLQAFGRELGDTVNPMWLLRTLPNNVLCHVGIRHGLKGPNACITNHSISGMLAIVEAMQAVRQGEAERAVAVGHDAPVEPQAVMYFHEVGLLAHDTIRSFDARRDGSLFGEGAAALVLEPRALAEQRGAEVLGEVLGSGCANDSQGLLAIDDEGTALADAIRLALDDARLRPTDVGMIVAHANGTRQSDTSEAAALMRVFRREPPPVTGFKWAFGHLIAASGIIETVAALWALRAGTVPGIATLGELDPACAGLPVSAASSAPRSDVALVISRGFGGTNAALLVRAPGSSGHA